MPTYKKWLWNEYTFPKRNCSHIVCDGEICIVNPIPLRGIMEWKFVSCLYVPILGGFRRIRKDRENSKTRKLESRIIYEKTVRDENVKLATMGEVYKFLQQYGLKLTIDLFSFNPKIDHEKTLDKAVWMKKLLIEDYSNGQELLQIPVVNQVDQELPAEMEVYTMSCVFENDEKNYKKKTTVCCDCKDNCFDKKNCACFQQTLRCYDPNERKARNGDDNIGYDYKRLPFNRQNMSGIYECNTKCACNDQCNNRVVQFPPKWKFQVFKEEATREKGYGVRTLNDIPAGSFVATYTGVMFKESTANMQTNSSEWRSAGKWKYFVNLLVLQNAEKVSVKFQSSPSSKPPSIRFGSMNFSRIFSLPIETKKLLPNHPGPSFLKKRTEELLTQNVEQWATLRTIFNAKLRLHKKEDPVKEEDKIIPKPRKKPCSHVYYTAPDRSLYKIPLRCPFPLIKKQTLKQSESQMPASPSLQIVSPESPSQQEVSPESPSLPKLSLPSSSLSVQYRSKMPHVKLIDFVKHLSRYKVESEPNVLNAKTENYENIAPLELKKENLNASEESIESTNVANSTVFVNKTRNSSEKARKRAATTIKSPVQRKFLKLEQTSPSAAETNGAESFESCESSTPCSSTKTPSSPAKSSFGAKASKIKGNYSLRKIEGKKYTYEQYDMLMRVPKKNCRVMPKMMTAKDIYLIDGRKKGNIGRFFNHSCDPNLFCQYVFYDTQDVRFPAVSFFAKKDIKAGQELTWCYNYDDDLDLDIDPLTCRCGASNCRGILIC